MNIVRVIQCGISILFLSPLWAGAAEPAKRCEVRMTFEEFRAHALKNSTVLAEIDLEFAESDAKAIEAATLSNPELQAEQTYTRKSGPENDNEAVVTVGQTVRPSDFGSRASFARLLARAGSVERRSKLLEFSQRLNVQYRTLAIYQRMRSTLAEVEKRAGDKITRVREGVRKGLLSQGDEKLFEGEKYRV